MAIGALLARSPSGRNPPVMASSSVPGRHSRSLGASPGNPKYTKPSRRTSVVSVSTTQTVPSTASAAQRPSGAQIAHGMPSAPPSGIVISGKVLPPPMTVKTSSAASRTTSRQSEAANLELVSPPGLARPYISRLPSGENAGHASASPTRSIARSGSPSRTSQMLFPKFCATHPFVGSAPVGSGSSVTCSPLGVGSSWRATASPTPARARTARAANPVATRPRRERRAITQALGRSMVATC